MWPVAWPAWAPPWLLPDDSARTPLVKPFPDCLLSVVSRPRCLQRDAERPSRIVLVRRARDGERQFQGFDGDQGAGFADQALEPVALTPGPMVVDWHPSVGSTNVGFGFVVGRAPGQQPRHWRLPLM